MLVTEDTASGCLERISRQDTLALDTETTGLGTFTGDKVCGVAVGTHTERMYFPFRHADGANLSGNRLRQLVKAVSGKTLRGFHLRFDVEMMYNEGLPIPPRLEDALIAALMMNENEPTFALKWSKNRGRGLAPKYLGADSISNERAFTQMMQDHGLTKGDIYKLRPEQVADYACDDLILPDRLLDEVYRPGLVEWKLGSLFMEMNDYQRLLIEMEIGGVPIDRAVVDRALMDGETQRAEVTEQILRIAGYPLNPNSWKQVAAACGTPNAQEETLARSGHPLAQLITTYKVLTKRDSTYLQRFIDFSDSKGVLHTQLNLTANEQGQGGTRSARLSGSQPNLQAMPKPKTNALYAPCRQAVRAPEGFSIVEADYSQMEVRLAGHYAQEPRLFEAFAESRDLYQEAADALRITRQESKILFLAIQYGAGVWKIAEMLGIDEDEAKSLRNRWHAQFPRIRVLMERLQDIAKTQKCIRLWTGRVGHFDGATKGANCKSPYYTGWNRLIQGAGAEMIRTAMMRLRESFQGSDARMILQVHDSIVFLVPTHLLRDVLPIIRRCMEDFPQFDIPMKVEIKAGPTWLDMKEVA